MSKVACRVQGRSHPKQPAQSPAPRETKKSRRRSRVPLKVLTFAERFFYHNLAGYGHCNLDACRDTPSGADA